MSNDLSNWSATPASNDLADYFQTGMAPSSVKTAGWDIMADLKQAQYSLVTSGGTANAQTLTQTRTIAAYFTGHEVTFLPGNANTGAVTIAIDGLAAKNIFANGAACVGGELSTTIPAKIKYDGTQYNLINPANKSNNNAQTLPTSGGTANAQTVTNSYPVPALQTGLYQWFLPGNANTGACTLAVDGLTAKSIFAYGAALLGGELQTNVPALVKYDGTQWNLINPRDATGSFTITLTGFTAGTTGTVNWRIVNGKTVYITPSTLISNTSNSTSMTGTGIPAAIVPTTAKIVLVRIRDSGTSGYGHLETGTSTTWTFGASGATSTTNFTASGTKGFDQMQFSYTLD